MRSLSRLNDKYRYMKILLFKNKILLRLIIFRCKNIWGWCLHSCYIFGIFYNLSITSTALAPQSQVVSQNIKIFSSLSIWILISSAFRAELTKLIHTVTIHQTCCDTWKTLLTEIVRMRLSKVAKSYKLN